MPRIVRITHFELADGSVSSERVFITADPDAATSTKSAVTIDLK